MTTRVGTVLCLCMSISNIQVLDTSNTKLISFMTLLQNWEKQYKPDKAKKINILFYLVNGDNIKEKSCNV